jgi:NAD(P)-dependent dehydrogenase (short-subunit alcohol dehydrogenase family)
MKIEKAVALVTGANRGIGAALVSELVARGARRVYAAARDPARVPPGGDRVVPVRLDVAAAAQIEAAARRAPHLTILFNNAGTLSSASLLSTPPAEIRREFEVNVFGNLGVTRAFLPALERAAGEAAIVNMLSVVSLASMAGLGAYSVSKAAAFSMTQALRAELGPRHIAVHAVFPGPVDTDMAREITLPKASPAEVARAIIAGVERGDEDIAPDPMSREVLAAWRASPKDVERQFRGM